VRAAVLSPSRWASFRLSKQFVALALAEAGHEVLYVDPPVSPLSALRDRRRLADLAAPALERPAPGLAVWRPRVLPAQDRASVQRINGGVVARGIARHLGSTDVTFAFGLGHRGTLHRVRGRRLYHCTDSLEDLPGVVAARVRRWEDEIVAAVDAVTACSLPLTDQLCGRGIDARYVPHGCDAGAFAERGEEPDELRGRPRPWVGYVGSLNFRIDVELLEAARRAAAGGTVVVVGGGFGPPPDGATRAFLRRREVAVLPQQSPDRLPAVTAALDVGLAPYREEPFNRKSFPIKIPQYLAAGLPVVSTPNGATDELGHALAVASGAEAFEAAVRTAVATADDDGDRAARRAAAGRTWDLVAAELLDAAGT
jgi:teichuronic acid biosynthesis glycosyltransferase TuaH